MEMLLIVLSGACYLGETILLALSIEFQADKLTKDDSRLQCAIGKMGGPALRNPKRHRDGIFLSCIGYVLLLLSTLY